ncbi:MAG: hypothetical protein Q7V14_07040 [Coriobacteriia bacterium]|nr:hypothetical protein [Coriobacteriia bacterium]
MRKLFSRLGVVLLVALFAMALPAQVFGAPVKLDDSTLFVQFWPEGETGTNVVIVGVELDAKTALPATVQLPIPKGATVFWAGEIIGPDPTTDIQRDFKLVDGAAGQLVEFTVETTRAVQFDATVGAIDIDGDDIVTSLKWLQSISSKSVSFAVRVPSAVDDIRITPKPPAGDPQTNSVGEKLYTLADQILQPGDTANLEVRYRRAGLASESSAPSVLVILAGLLVLAVVALVVALAVQNRRRIAEEE